MILGAFAYDPSVVNRCLTWLNAGWMLEDSVIVRLPVMLTLATASMLLFTALGFRDLEARIATLPQATRNELREGGAEDANGASAEGRKKKLARPKTKSKGTPRGHGTPRGEPNQSRLAFWFRILELTFSEQH